MTRDDVRYLAQLSGLLLALSTCSGLHAKLPAVTSTDDFRHRDSVDRARLAHTRSVADAHPLDARAQFVAGMAHARASLVGHLDDQETAEHYLERAYRLDPNAFPSARVLGRFANMRASVLDTSKVDLQVELYRSLQRQPPADPMHLDAAAFHVHGFVSADLALRDVADGRWWSAWQRVRRLEHDLADRTRRYPDEIDSFAMAGTFTSTFAAVLPLGRKRRAKAAAEYFEVQQTRWDELSASARNEAWAPNTRTVFALALGELWLAAGDRDRAKMAYERVHRLDVPATKIRRQLLDVVDHRLAHLDDYAGQTELLPPWPSGTTGCVACHAEDTRLPERDLYIRPELAQVMQETR